MNKPVVQYSKYFTRQNRFDILLIKNDFDFYTFLDLVCGSFACCEFFSGSACAGYNAGVV